MFTRFTALLLGLSPWVHADLIAKFTTTEGVVDVILDYTNAPQAVANFIKLSQGTQARIDPTTGRVTTDPLYVGENFFRTANNSSFKFAQTGSGTGTNAGSTGYTFKDEFTSIQRHTGYTLSMANSGPNTNGGQIFLTGDVSIPSYDDVHSIVGNITSASESVVDAIIAAGDNGSSISAVQIVRTDPAAVAFDENAQNLPTLTAITGTLDASSGGTVALNPQAPLIQGDLLSVYRSPDLATWGSLDSVFCGYDNTPLPSPTLDETTLIKAFYQLVKIHHPDSPTPSSIAGRSLFVNVPAAGGTLTFDFNSSGEGGTTNYPPGTTPDGTITSVSHSAGGYGSTFVIQSTNLNPLLIKPSYDGENATQLTGRVSLSVWNGSQWNSVGSGTATLTK